MAIMTTTLVAIFATSFGACLLLTPCLRFVADRLGLVDHPDGRRKIHARPIPLAGGLAILLSACTAFGAALLWRGRLHAEVFEQPHNLLGLLLAALVICGVGVMDDYGLLRGRHKLLGQLVAIGIVIAFGVRVERISVFTWQIELGLLAIPFTAFLLLGAINSLNLLDGMDGMLSSIGLIICLAMAAMALIGHHGPSACVALALAGALLGFLRYNFPPASIFLGDSGSMLIGLVIGVLAIQCSLKAAATAALGAPATAALAAPLATLTIPILDTTAAILRRKLTGRSIYSTDRGHLHHCLLNRGLSSRVVLLWVAFFCMLTGVGALASLALNNELCAWLTAITVAAILVRVRIFGHGEFQLAKQRLTATARSFLRIRSNGRIQATEVHLQGSVQWRDVWEKFTACAHDLNLKMLNLDVNAPSIHEGYHARWNCPYEESENPSLWFAEMPLVVRGQAVGRLDITGHRDAEPVWMKIAHVARLVEDVEANLVMLFESSHSPAHTSSTPIVATKTVQFDHA
jgi:UDP-GlcNAc:undecaprenyl-phosphate GlcNAc-1-phosphate transferase